MGEQLGGIDSHHLIAVATLFLEFLLPSSNHLNSVFGVQCFPFIQNFALSKLP